MTMQTYLSLAPNPFRLSRSVSQCNEIPFLNGDLFCRRFVLSLFLSFSSIYFLLCNLSRSHVLHAFSYGYNHHTHHSVVAEKFCRD